jgi:hypothetical protein
MDSPFRAAFNRAYTPALFNRYRTALERELGPVAFRLAETPLFVDERLRADLKQHALEIVEQLSAPATLEKLKKAIPAHYDTPGMDVLPNCLQVDFALSPGEDGRLVGKVVELQAFPSGHAMMTFFARAWHEAMADAPGLQRDWTCFLDMSEARGLELMRKMVLGDVPPENVALVDFEPENQKTSPDFVATEKLFGVQAECATRLIREGRALYRKVNGKRVKVERIYNRMVFDELEVKGYRLPFDFRDDLDLTWASHPNWYWVWSKYSLPFLRHEAVPRSRFLSEVKELPADLSRYVLKPLFSFAGGGVVIDVTPEDIQRVPEEQRDRWVLQEKIAYAPAVVAPGGAGVKAEVRVMLLRPPDETKLTPVILLARLSRGKMIGVDQNKGDLDWQGGSVSIWPA